jgi:hypothetical protein
VSGGTPRMGGPRIALHTLEHSGVQVPVTHQDRGLGPQPGMGRVRRGQGTPNEVSKHGPDGEMPDLSRSGTSVTNGLKNQPRAHSSRAMARAGGLKRV